MNKLLTKEEIFKNPEIYVKWLCYDIYITIDNQVFSISKRKLKEQLIGGSYCYFCNGKYRTKKWIRVNCTNVLGKVTI
jgi:hypothetical protein